MAPLRVLVVGHGLIGSQRAAAIHALGERLDVCLAGTIDPIERPADLYGGTPHSRVLSPADIRACDAAVLALPHRVATATAKRVLDAGKPILIEKPLGVTGADARELESAAAAIERQSYVGYNYRFLPHVRQLLQAAHDGRLGALRSIEMMIGHGGHPNSSEGWKLRPELGGGGVLLDPGVHLFDLVLQLAPTAEPRIVEGTRGFWETGIEEDLVVVFRDGALLATVRVSHIRWVNTMRIEVFGTDGYVLLEGRGANYGRMTARSGRRWAWHDDRYGRSQRETEEVHDYGDVNRSLEEELEAVMRRWLGASFLASVEPATMADGRRVTELAESLYGMLPP
jgi:predicted dehydrogenase